MINKVIITRPVSPPFLTIIKILTVYSFNEQEQLRVPVCHWQGRLWQSLASRVPKDQVDLRNERDVKGKNHHEAISDISNEREEAAGEAVASILSQYQLRLPG